jgi:hypothetical protein
MDHPSPASFPDPVQRIGTPVTPPPGTEPNPAYQDLLTLYARVYGAGDRLEKALRPAGRTVSGGETWTGPAARRWTTELDGWNRRLGHAAARILTELAERLRATPPYVAVGTRPMNPGDPYPGAPYPGGSYPGGPYPQPGGPLHAHPDPGGTMHSGPSPGGRMHPGPNPGGALQPGPVDPGQPLHAHPDPGGRLRPEPDPGGTDAHQGQTPA